MAYLTLFLQVLILIYLQTVQFFEEWSHSFFILRDQVPLLYWQSDWTYLASIGHSSPTNIAKNCVPLPELRISEHVGMF